MAFRQIGEVLNEMLAEVKDGGICTRCLFQSYEPRGDSVLEQSFWRWIKGSAGSWHGAIDQFQIGKYRVDAIFDCDGEAVVIELDGKAYHDRAKDHLRDKELIQHVSGIIRIPFAAMWWYSQATIQALGSWYPRFSKPINQLVLTYEEFLEEWQNVQDDPYTLPEDYLEDVNDQYQIYKIDGNAAFLGTPKQFIYSSPKQLISLQRGQGTADWIIPEIYKRSECLPIVSRRAA